MRTSLFLVVLLAACGNRSGGPVTPPADGSISTDGAPGTDASISRSDSGGVDASGIDAGTPTEDGGTSTAGCGTDMVDPGLRLPRSCYNDPGCYDHPLCVAAMLEADGRSGYTECGDAVPFDAAMSDEICNVGPPFGDWGVEFMCGRASFEGTTRFFCSPDGSTVLLRFSGSVRSVTPGDYYTYYGHDYWSGSGGGSGHGYSVSTPLEELSGDAFVGFEPIERTSDGAGGWNSFSVTVFFITGGLIDMSYFIGGGLSVTYSEST